MAVPLKRPSISKLGLFDHGPLIGDHWIRIDTALFALGPNRTG